MATKVWVVRSGLAAMFDAALTDVRVFDGPATEGPPKNFVTVGSDGGDTGFGDGGDDGATIEQAASSMSNDWRDEVGEIVCAAWSWSGGTNFIPLRARVTTAAATCEAALYADRTIGGVLDRSNGDLAEFSGLRIREVQTPKGGLVRAAFTVAYRALITN